MTPLDWMFAGAFAFASLQALAVLVWCLMSPSKAEAADMTTEQYWESSQ